MDTAVVMAWVDRYVAGWRSADVGAVAQLFSDGAQYRTSPYDPARVGHAAIAEFWTVDEGEEFTVTARPVAVQEQTAVVRLVVTYLAGRNRAEPQEYTDLWILEFGDDGRVDSYEEWPFWPGKEHTAAGDD